MNTRIAPVLLAVYLALFSVFVVLNISYYFDIVPYVATTLMTEIQDPVGLHSATYGLLENQLAPDQFAFLINGPYAEGLFLNSQYFYSQLDLYLSKPLYVLGLRVLYLIGINPVDGLLVMSLIPALGILIVVFNWLKVYVSPMHALIATIFFSIAARLTALTQGLVHNNLSSFLIITAMFILIEKRKEWLAMALFCLSIAVRTDNIIFVTIVLAALILRHISHSGFELNRKLGIRISGLACAIAIYLWVSVFYEQSWWPLFYHSLVESQLDLESFSINFSPVIYFSVLFDNAKTLFSSGAFTATLLPVFLLMIFVSTPINSWKLSIYQFIRPSRRLTPFDLTLLSIPVFVAYLLLFPLVVAWDRFFTHFYALFVIAIAYNFSVYKRSDTLDIPEDVP